MCWLVNDTGRFSLNLQPCQFCRGHSFPFYISWRCCMRFQTGGLMCKQKPFRSPTEGSFFLPSKNPDQVDCLQLGCRSSSKLFKGHKNPWAQLLFLEEKPRWQMLLCTPPNMCQREQTCLRVVYNAGEEEVSWVGCIKYIFMYTLLWSSLWGYLSTSQTLRKGVTSLSVDIWSFQVCGVPAWPPAAISETHGSTSFLSSPGRHAAYLSFSKQHQDPISWHPNPNQRILSWLFIPILRTEEPRQSVILDNGCKSVLLFGGKQCLGGQTLFAEDAGCCQLQVTTVTAVSVLVFGKQLLKEHYGTKSYLWNLGSRRKSVLKTRLSPGSQAVQFTAIAAVILSYNGSL